MSHVAIVKVEIKDLKVLAEVCSKLGLKFNEGQKTYKWFGRSVGDYPLPTGFSAKDLGKCDHAISIEGNAQAYEIGVVKNPQDAKSHCLLWDFWQGGFGLQAKVGNNCEKLIHEYTKAVTKKQLQKMANEKGYTMSEDFNEQTGETTIKLRKY